MCEATHLLLAPSSVFSTLLATRALLRRPSNQPLLWAAASRSCATQASQRLHAVARTDGDNMKRHADWRPAPAEWQRSPHGRECHVRTRTLRRLVITGSTVICLKQCWRVLARRGVRGTLSRVRTCLISARPKACSASAAESSLAQAACPTRVSSLSHKRSTALGRWARLSSQWQWLHRTVAVAAWMHGTSTEARTHARVLKPTGDGQQRNRCYANPCMFSLAGRLPADQVTSGQL